MFFQALKVKIMNKKLMTVIATLFIFTLYSIAIPLSDNNLSKEKEIGRLFNPLKGWQYDDFTFSSNGDFLYTYKNKSLYSWRFLPKIEYLGSFYVGIIKDRKNTSFIHLAPNNKIVFRTSNNIEIWNLKTMKILIKQKIASISGVSAEDGFVILKKNKNLKKLDFNSLKIIEEKQIENHCSGIEVENTTIFSCKCSNLLYINNTINIVCEYYVSCLKSKTLTERGFSYFNPSYTYLSIDNKYLYSDNKLINRINCMQKTSSRNKHKFATIRHISKKSFILKSLLIKEKKFSNGLRVLEVLVVNKDKKSKKIIGFFAHNDNGDWFFKQSGDFYFDTSLSFNKLKMKLSDGSIVLMNSQTFNKYYKKINFKELKYGKR